MAIDVPTASGQINLNPVSGSDISPGIMDRESAPFIQNQNNAVLVVTRNDVAKVVDLVYYLIWDYSALRAIFAPQVVRNKKNELILAEKGYLKSKIFYDVAANAQILYNDIKNMEYGVTTRGLENLLSSQRVELHRSKLLSLQESFDQMRYDLVSFRNHFEGGHFDYPIPIKYDIIGNQPDAGSSGEKSLSDVLAEDLEKLVIDYSVCERSFFTGRLDEGTWNRYWMETPHPSKLEKDIVDELAAVEDSPKCRKSPSFVLPDSPSQPQASSAVADRPSTRKHQTTAAIEANTTPIKFKSSSDSLLTPPPTSKKSNIKSEPVPIHATANPAKATKAAKAKIPRIRQPRAPKSRIARMRYNKKKYSEVIEVLLAQPKKPWSLLDKSPKDMGARQPRTSRMAAKVAVEKIKKGLKTELKIARDIKKEDVDDWVETVNGRGKKGKGNSKGRGKSAEKVAQVVLRAYTGGKALFKQSDGIECGAKR